MVIVQGETELLEVIAALHAAGSLPSALHRWQKQSNQDADNRYDHQQFHQGKSRPAPHHDKPFQ
jgi:hypothetical protein